MLLFTESEPLTLKRSELEKIAEGNHREVFIHGNYIVKIAKPMVKAKVLGVGIYLPSAVSSFFRTGHLDLNGSEILSSEYLKEKVPSALTSSFNFPLGTAYIDGELAILAHPVKNADGTLSKNLTDTGTIKDAFFWERVDDLERVFLDEDLRFFGISARNVLVQHMADGHYLPVLHDYERAGSLLNFPQFNLLLKSERQAKIKRRFARLRDDYFAL